MRFGDDFQRTEISPEGKINVNVKSGHFSSCTDIQTQPFCHFFFNAIEMATRRSRTPIQKAHRCLDSVNDPSR